MRELFQTLSLLEARLLEQYGVSLNEAMVLCSVGSETVTAGTIVERTGLTPSHASKVISQIEKRGMLVRTLSEKDRRQMCFTLTDKAELCLKAIKDQGIDIPDSLLPLFKDKEDCDEKEKI